MHKRSLYFKTGHLDVGLACINNRSDCKEGNIDAEVDSALKLSFDMLVGKIVVSTT